QFLDCSSTRRKTRDGQIQLAKSLGKLTEHRPSYCFGVIGSCPVSLTRRNSSRTQCACTAIIQLFAFRSARACAQRSVGCCTPVRSEARGLSATDQLCEL